MQLKQLCFAKYFTLNRDHQNVQYINIHDFFFLKVLWIQQLRLLL